MLTHDAINAVFEAGGGLLLCLNVARLLRDRTIAGVSIVPAAWITAWGLWNLIYYPALGQWFSFAAGLLVVTANATWVILALRLARRPHAERGPRP